MVINRDVVKNVPLCCYGFIIFLVVNVYLLWGVALPASHAQTLCDYDAIIQPFRFGASGTMAIVPLLVLVAELSANRVRKILRTMLLPCAALGSVLGLLFFVGATISVDSPPLYGIAGVLVGVGNSCCFLLWGVVLARLTREGCTLVLLLSGVGSGLLNLALFSLPSTLGYPIVAILLVLSLGSLWMSLRDLPALPTQDQPPSPIQRLKNLGAGLGEPLLCVCALALAFNVFREVAFAQAGGTAMVNTVSMLGLIVGTGAILAMLAIFKVKAPEVSGIYPLATLVVAACMVPFPFVGPDFYLSFVFVISVFYLLVETLFKGVVAAYARSSGESALAAFGVGFGIEFAMMGVGSFMGALPRGAGGENQVMYVIALVLLCMYLLVVPLVSAYRKHKGKAAKLDAETSTLVQERLVIRPVNADELQQRCEMIAARSGISQSERAVMVLLAAGQTVAAISRRLSLSENTIRSHSKAIYRKLDVHSKQELIDLVANFQSTDGSDNAGKS